MRLMLLQCLHNSQVIRKPHSKKKKKKVNKKPLQTSVPCLPGLLEAPRGQCDWQDFGVGRKADTAHTSLETRLQSPDRTPQKGSY